MVETYVNPLLAEVDDPALKLTSLQRYLRRKKLYLKWTYNRILDRVFTQAEFEEVLKEVEEQHGVLESPTYWRLYDFDDRLLRAIRSTNVCEEVHGGRRVFIKRTQII